VLYGVADQAEKFEPSGGRQVMFVAIGGELWTPDEFHDEVGPARFGFSRVKHPRDVGVIHQGEGLTLDFEAGDDLSRIHAELDDFQRDAATHRLFLFGHPDDAAPALAEFLEQFVAADLMRFAFGGSRGRSRRPNSLKRGQRGGSWRCFHETAGGLVGLEQPDDALAERAVFSAGFVEVRRAFISRKYECVGKHLRLAID
jgi:hypothetical protein